MRKDRQIIVLPLKNCIPEIFISTQVLVFGKQLYCVTNPSNFLKKILGKLLAQSKKEPLFAKKSRNKEIILDRRRQ